MSQRRSAQGLLGCYRFRLQIEMDGWIGGLHSTRAGEHKDSGRVLVVCANLNSHVSNGIALACIAYAATVSPRLPWQICSTRYCFAYHSMSTEGTLCGWHTPLAGRHASSEGCIRTHLYSILRVQTDSFGKSDLWVAWTRIVRFALTRVKIYARIVFSFGVHFCVRAFSE